jgi:LysR family transcriptional regulator, glycine cleavage system transcriptional activator
MENWLPSLNALRAFEAVSRHLSYRDAAEELHVTPAAVKQLVLKLEDALGAPLLKRQGRGIALTDVGLTGLSDLNSGFKHLHRAVGAMRDIRERHTLTITVEPSFAIAWLIKRIVAFEHANPDVDVLIDSSMRVVDLDRENVDVAIRYGVTPTGGLNIHRLFDDEIIAVCSPSLAKGPPSIETLADLENASLIHLGMDPGSPVTTNLFDWQSWFETIGAGHLKPIRMLSFNDYNLAIQAAIAGHGMVLGSWPVVKDAIEAGLLVSPLKESAKFDIGYDLVTTKAAAAKSEVAAFTKWILTEIEN